jgi:hypothetical protein
MAVVINEFEVVTAEPRTRENGQQAEPERAEGPPRDQAREIERHLHQRQARALRLMAT